MNGPGDARHAYPTKCSQCAYTMEQPLYCEHCRTLYSAEGMSHFQVLGLDVGYDVDLDELNTRHLNLARAIHPDRFPDAADEVSQLSLVLSAQINRARQVLSDPALRAEYLLDMLGAPAVRADKSVPEHVLTRTLEMRERLDEALAHGDEDTTAACRDEVGRWRTESLEQVATLARRLPGDVELQRSLRRALNALRYYQKLLELAR